MFITGSPMIEHHAEYNASKEKQRLQNLMSYGSDMEPTARPPMTQPQQGEEEERDRFDEGKETT